MLWLTLYSKPHARSPGGSIKTISLCFQDLY
jgi:hypothetical protein